MSGGRLGAAAGHSAAPSPRSMVVWVPPVHAVCEGAVDNTADLVVAGRTVAWRLTHAELTELADQVSDALDGLERNVRVLAAEVFGAARFEDELA